MMKSHESLTCQSCRLLADAGDIIRVNHLSLSVSPEANRHALALGDFGEENV